MVWSKCSRNGIRNCNSFLTIQEESLLEQLRTKSASAYDYLDKIPMEQWCNTQWIATRKLHHNSDYCPGTAW